MARTSFGRTVKLTICEVMYYDVNNEKQHAEIEIFGDYNIESAVKPVSRVLKTRRFVIDNIRHKSFYGRMTFEEFAKVCEKTNIKEW